MRLIKIYKQVHIYTIVLLSTFVVKGQETMFQAMQLTTDLRLSIIADWDTVRNLYGETECDAKTIINDVDWKSQLRLRGVSRRRKCDSMLIPLRLQFKKKELRKAGFKEFRNHKIVTCCLENDAGHENLQEEILIYQLYQILTDQSFRSVEAELTMRWPDDVNPQKITPILILEPNKEMANRLGGIEVEAYNFPADSLDAESYNRNAMFQFMVGNFDWTQSSQRNIKMIRVGAKVLIVPYDFDFSAIVSPAYASIPPDLGIKDFKDRIYLGEFFIDQIPATRAEFIGKKEEIYEHVLNFEGLKKYRRKEIKKYLGIFFNYIQKPNSPIAYKTILPFK